MIDRVKIFEDSKRGIFASIHKLRTISENSKTGDVAGLYVLPMDKTPTESIKTRTDDAQCGDCPLKRTVCYVNPVSTNGVWRSAQDLPITPLRDFDIDKPLRLGIYGDPAFLPPHILDALAEKAPRILGYTHQWHRRSPQYSRHLMASIDNLMAARQGLTAIQLKNKANAKGYRTFRAITPGQRIAVDEIMCPHTTHGTQCADCGLCHGAGKEKNIVVEIHGPANKVKTYSK